MSSRGSGATGKRQRNAFDRLRRKRRQIGDLLHRDRKLDVVESLDDFLRRNLELHSNQCRADTAVDACTEGQVRSAVAAIQVQRPRTREVGIRKVLGASLGSILYLFSRDFVALILIAFLIAGPVAWLVMHRWLESFAYRIGIGWGTFVLSVAASFIIAGITISYESIKAAIVPPVKSLRTE